jgi:hypothetical protein
VFDHLAERGFQFAFASHAAAILEVDFPEAIGELETALDGVSVPIEEIIGSGGGETKGTQRLRRALDERGWPKHTFEVAKVIDGVPRGSTSHEVDHVRRCPNGVVALEIEWNNKDPFFDRDLENFKRLHAEGAISLGVIVTRGASPQDSLGGLVRRFAEERQIQGVADLARLGLNPTKRQQNDFERRMRSGVSFSGSWSQSFIQDKFGQATTHWRKLDDRLKRGVGNPCPLVLVGLPASVVTFGERLDVGQIAGGDDSVVQ